MKLFPSDHKIFEDVKEVIQQDFPNIHLCVSDQFESQARPICQMAVHEDLEPIHVVHSVLEKNIQHLVQKNKNRFIDDLNVGAKIIEDYQQYFHSEFKIYGGSSLESVRLQFKSTGEKKALKDQIHDFVQKIGSESVGLAVDSIFEELYMNAMFDAPRESRKRNWEGTSDASELFLDWSAHNLQISCTDFYGSLDIEKMLRRMEEVYVKGVAEAMNLSTGSGAGIGCVILFENSSAMYLGVIPGRMTKVTCVVPLGMSNRQRERMKKSLHWFSI